MSGEPEPPQLGNMFVKLVLNAADVPRTPGPRLPVRRYRGDPATVLPEFGGITIAIFRDPDGYRIELVGRPVESV